MGKPKTWLTVKRGLEKLHYESKNIELNLCKLLSQYRICTHAQTGKVPAEVFFNRKINSHLDFMKPSYNLPENTSGVEGKKFTVGERVSVRNYVGKVKWFLGRIESKVGIFQYEVLLDNNKVVRRTVNQMRKIGDKTPLNFESIKYYPPPPISQNSRETVIIEPTVVPATSQPTRASTRVRKEPDRLMYK